MDSHPLSKSISDLASVRTVFGATLDTKAVVFSICNEKANAEWKATANKVSWLATDRITERSMLSRLPSSMQV